MQTDITLKRSPVSNKFPLIGAEPDHVTPGGTVTKADKDRFPAVTGNAAAVFMVKMKPGALREPHWHPNCWEMNVVIHGQARVGVVNPDDTWSEDILGVGEVSFIPQGFFHYIEAVGEEELVIAVVFNADKPQDIGLSTGFAGLPTRTFSATLHHSLEGVPKPNETLLIVDEG